MVSTTKGDARPVAIYARISQDGTGEGEGVERQLADCRAMLPARPRAVEYVDNDVSAFSGIRRPEFERLMADVAAGRVGAVYTYSADRLYRRLVDLERIVDTFTAAGVAIHTVRSGDVDLDSADGRSFARIMGTLAQRESEKTAERIRRQKKARRDQGVYHSSLRPFGWHKVAGEWLPKPDEAELVAAAYADFLAGTSLRAIMSRWRDAGVVGVKGVTMTAVQVRAIIMNSRHAGLLAYHGELVRDDDGNPQPIADGRSIVDVATWTEAQIILRDPNRRTSTGRPARTLLSGLVRCGRCGEKMTSAHMIEKSKVRRHVYVCQKGDQHLTRSIERVDDPILALAARALSEHAEAITKAAPGTVERAAAETRVEALQQRRAELAALVASGALAPADFAAATRHIENEIEQVSLESVPTAGTALIVRLLREDDPETALRNLMARDPEAAREIMRTLFADIVLHPVKPGAYATPNDITYEWAS